MVFLIRRVVLSIILVKVSLVLSCLNHFHAIIESRCNAPSGLSAMSILYLTSNGLLGHRNAGESIESVKAKTCDQKTAFVVWGKCLQDLVLNLTKSRECPPGDVTHIQQRIKTTVLRLHTFCKRECRTNIIKRANECFKVVNSTTSFSNMTILQDKFEILGTKENSIRFFCRQHEQFYDCLHEINSFCLRPYIGSLIVRGFDLMTMQQGTRLLCEKRNAYMEAVHCVRRQKYRVFFCRNESGLRALRDEYRHHHIKPYTFFDDLCRIRLQQLICEMDVYKRVCPSTMSLKIKFECITLPIVCMRHKSLKSNIQKICHAFPEMTTVALPATPSDIELLSLDLSNITEEQSDVVLAVSAGNFSPVSAMLFFFITICACCNLR